MILFFIYITDNYPKKHIIFLQKLIYSYKSRKNSLIVTTIYININFILK